MACALSKFSGVMLLASTLIASQAFAATQQGKGSVAKKTVPAAKAPGDANRSIDNAFSFLVVNQGMIGSGGWCKFDLQACGRSGAPAWENMAGPVVISSRPDGCHILLRFGKSFIKDGKDAFYQIPLNWQDVVEIQKRSGAGFSLADGATEFLLLVRDGTVISLTTLSVTMPDRFAQAFSYLKRNCAASSNLGF